MDLLAIGPRPGDPGVAVHPVQDHVGVRADLLAQPGHVVVDQVAVPGGLALEVQVAVVQHNVVEAHQIAGRVHVHLADGLGVVTAGGHLAGQRALVGPRHAILVADPAVIPLAHAGEQAGARGDARRRGGVGLAETDALRGELIQVRGLNDGMAIAAEAIAAPLVGHQEDDIGTVGHDGLPAHGPAGRDPPGVFHG